MARHQSRNVVKSSRRRCPTCLPPPIRVLLSLAFSSAATMFSASFGSGFIVCLGLFVSTSARITRARASPSMIRWPILAGSSRDQGFVGSWRSATSQPSAPSLLPRPPRPAPDHPDALTAASTVSASLVRPTLRPHADSALNSLGSIGPTRLALSFLALFSASMRLLDRAGPASLGSGWARGTTAADFGRRTRRDGCVVKDSYDRIVRQNYDHDALPFLGFAHCARAALPDLTALLPWVRTSGWRWTGRGPRLRGLQ